MPEKTVAGARETWAATARNTEPIFGVLKDVVPANGTLLEIASGTGQHAGTFAPRLPQIVWQTSERNPDHFSSINAWVDEVDVPNLRRPVPLDVLEAPWPVETDPPAPPVSMIFNVNMIHIAPWAICEALLDGAGRILPAGGVLFLYGPYREAGQFRSEGDAAFDEDLRGRNADWGIRDRETVVAEAEARGLQLERRVEMPANNLSLIFVRED